MADVTLIRLPEENIEPLFDLLDRNRDLVIDKHELIDAIDFVYPFVSKYMDFPTFFRLASDMFVAADTHTNGVLTYLELLQFFTV
tara:strand:- start:618 stop:872 length:255 start_codon:yes stop_codon:yes gene_type:complete